MKILCLYTDAGPSFVRNGWRRAFEACGHTFRFWSPAHEPAFDVFSQFEPDLAILTTYDLDRATEKCIRSRPELRVIMFASAWGELVDGLDPSRYPIVRVSEQEKARLEKLKADTGKPDYVFIHVTDKFLGPTMGGWNSIGIRPVGILNGFDSILYRDATYREELACDVGFVGSRWPYKAINLDRYVIPLCHPRLNLRVKIFGGHGWPVHQYLGSCSDEINRDLHVSATISPNVSEPHSTDLGFDLVERPYKIMGVGGFCISDYVEETRELFDENTLLMTKTPEEFQSLIQRYLRFPEERLPLMKAGQAAVLKDHTYFDRVAQMFFELGLEEQSQLVLKAKYEANLLS